MRSETLYEVIRMVLECLLVLFSESFNARVRRNATLVHFFKESNRVQGFVAMFDSMGHAYLLEMSSDTCVKISVFRMEIS